MQFLDRFPEAERERLLAAGRIVRLDRGEFLIRQGERGGDVFLVEDGTFEVVDARSTPEVVLNVVGSGTVLGEMAFLDEAPRGADVRAITAATCRLWERTALREALDREPELGAAFYRALASTMVDRMRDVTENAVAGGFGGASHSTTHVSEAIGRYAHDLAGTAQLRWIRAEARLRRNVGDGEARAEVRAAFFDLLKAACEWIDGFTEPADATAAGASLARELRPYLVRASTAEMSLEPLSQRSGEPRLLAHVLLGRGSGDGVFGQVLDEALLALPTCEGLRARTVQAARAVEAALPARRPARISLVNAATGALLARIVPSIAVHGAHLTCVDGSREALAFLDAGLTVRPRTIDLRLAVDDLVLLCQGSSGVLLGGQDVFVVEGLCEYLPDRLVAALLGLVRRHLAPGGSLVLTSLVPSVDASIFDHLLGWPMVRRSARSLVGLVEASGFCRAEAIGSSPAGSPALVVTARQPVGADDTIGAPALAAAPDTA